MMGRQSGGQEKLFYSFNLDDHVPQKHLLRGIDQHLDLSDLRKHLSDFYSHTGRPSIDPELMIRMLIIGYSLGIRSERRLCEEVHLNLAYRWFCHLGLEDKVPDHSTFSKNRHGRFRESEAFRHLFETVLKQCMAEGLVSGEGFAIDASIIQSDASSDHSLPGNEPINWNDDVRATRAVKEYLTALEEENSVATTPKRISLTDPATRWTCAPGGPAFFAYSTNYLIDIDAGIIVDVEATPANRSNEVDSTRTMIDRVEERFGMKPHHLIGDTAYGSAPMLSWMIEDKQIEPHVPVWGKERNDGIFNRSDFTYDAGLDRYTCPMGNHLNTTGRATSDNYILYRSKNLECRDCPAKLMCCPKTPQRKISRSIHEQYRDVARALSTTDAYKQSRKDRKKVEMLFAHLKRILKLDRLRLRGLSGAQDEFLLAATAQNLRRMAQWCAPTTTKRVIGHA